MVPTYLQFSNHSLYFFDLCVMTHENKQITKLREILFKTFLNVVLTSFQCIFMNNNDNHIVPFNHLLGTIRLNIIIVKSGVSFIPVLAPLWQSSLKTDWRQVFKALIMKLWYLFHFYIYSIERLCLIRFLHNIWPKTCY